MAVANSTLCTYFPDVVGDVEPGMVTEIWPPHMHMHMQLSSSTGELLTMALPPGAHGELTTGWQGMGVSTPAAAEVALDTWGLLNDWHMPKGAMFVMGILSAMLPTGLFSTFGRVGSTTENVAGAIPKVH